MKTRLTALAAAVSSLSMLTACGGGGGGSGDVPEFTPVPLTVYSSAEGAWTGTVGSGGATRTLSGTITHEGAFWLVYNTGVSAVPEGFYSGAGALGVDDNDPAIATFGSSGLREFNFSGTSVRGGTLDASLPKVVGGNVDNSTTLAGNLIGGGNTFEVNMQTSVFFPAANGPLNMIGFTGTWDADTNSGQWTGTTSIPGFNTVMHYTQTFTMNEQTGAGKLNVLNASTCTDNTGSACSGLGQPLSGALFNTAVNPPNPNTYKIKVPFTPVDGWTGQWTLQVNKATTDPDTGETTVEYIPMYFNVTLHGASLPSIPAGNTPFSVKYSSIYETKPSLTTIAGSYTGTPAYTGIGTTKYTDTATFTISSGGAITGGEATTGCAYTGAIALHRRGNVYDVSGLTFTGGSCPYTSSGTFIGIATYNAGKLTLTATNSARDKGFMVVVSKP